MKKHETSQINKLIKVAEEAGKRIIKIYEDSKVSQLFIKKYDNSPLTKADIVSHNYIVKSLKDLTPNIPILSEENSDQIILAQRSRWDPYWLIDPLDGTREFLNRTGEFTVNIALIKDRVPIIGIINVPCMNKTYYAQLNQGSFVKHEKNIRKIDARPSSSLIKILISRSQVRNKQKHFIDKIKSQLNSKIELIPMGSSLKFCAIADGLATIYPRFAPTMEWDTAAGEIIVREAGGSCLAYKEKKPLQYNKPDLTNPSFIAFQIKHFPKLLKLF